MCRCEFGGSLRGNAAQKPFACRTRGARGLGPAPSLPRRRGRGRRSRSACCTYCGVTRSTASAIPHQTRELSRPFASVRLDLHLSGVLEYLQARTADSELKMVLCGCPTWTFWRSSSWRLLARLVHCVVGVRAFSRVRCSGPCDSAGGGGQFMMTTV